ncbi:MAG: tetratricopeptide repeat protein [Polyangiales bacterium]
MLARYEPSFEGLLAPSVRARAETTQRAVIEGIRRALAVCAAGAPLALVLDDLQWADELSLAIVESLARADARPAGLTVIAASRADELPDALRGLRDSDEVCRVDLDRLGVTEVAALVRGLLALRDVPAELTEFVYARSEGNPFFAAEYVRAAIAEGHLRRDEAGRWFLSTAASGDALRSSVPAPATVSEVVAWRLADLGAAASTTLAAAAVLGREPHGEVLSAVAGLSEGALFEALDELRRRQVLEPATGGRLRFAHDLFRETAARRIAPDLAKSLHHSAAEASERHPSTRDDVESIGLHWARAGVDDRAARCLGRAADLARAACANQRAVALYDAAYHHASTRFDGPEASAWVAFAAAVDERRGDVLERQGAHDEARAAYARSYEARRAGDHADRARLKRLQAKTWEALHRHDEARVAYDAASAELDAAPEATRDGAWWRERVEVLVERVWLHYWLGEVDAMTSLVERARPLVVARGDGPQRARFYQAIMHNDLRRKRYRVGEETVRASRASVDAANDGGDAGAIAYARFILAFSLLFSDAHGEAEVEMRAALSGAQRAGDAVLTLRCRTYLTVTLRRLGRVDDAAEEARACLAASRALRMKDYEGVARANLAWAAWRRGARAEATREADEAVSIWRELAARFVYPLEWLARLPAIACALEDGRDGDAVEHARGLLGPVQHDLSDAVLRQSKSAVEAHERGRAFDARTALTEIVRSALSEGLL